MNLLAGLLSFVVKADFTNPAVTIPGGGSGINFLSNLLPGIISVLLVGISLVFLIMLILGSIQWITAGGDKGKIETARYRILHALIGFVIGFGVFAFVNFIGCVFGIDFFRINIGVLDVSFGTSPLCPTGSNAVCTPACEPGYICENKTCIADPNWPPGGGEGTCTCAGGEVTGNSCTIGNPYCIGQSTCICATGSGSVCTPPCNPGYICQDNECIQDPYAQCSCLCSGGSVTNNNCASCPGDTAYPLCMGQNNCGCVDIGEPANPTPTGISIGTCQCDLSVVMENNCTSQEVPRCIGQFSCVCETPTCTPTCPNGWFCSYQSCCQCVYGLSQINEFGPVTCCPAAYPGNDCETHNVYGCRPAP